jgi:predicted Rossmann fold flavoprotein
LNKSSTHIIVIGGGAAGFFSAINCAILYPQYQITLLEKTTKLLSKVRISGGGRCNVTHQCFENNELVKYYPRGEKELRQVFARFSVQETIDWFKSNGVNLKVEEDGRMFPTSNSSESIIDCFIRLSKQLNIQIKTNHEVLKLESNEKGFSVKVKSATDIFYLEANAVICSIGGHAKEEPYRFIKALGHTITPLLPSLFTINLPNDNIKKELQGVAVQKASVKLNGTNYNYTGSILITHWGLSGPAVLKLSAFAAQAFFEKNYEVGISINWTGDLSLEEIKILLHEQQKEKHKALPINQAMFQIPRRLWEYLCTNSLEKLDKPWAEITKKELQRLTENVFNSQYQMQGKTTFKEEFVTCGGVHLKEIDFKTMQSKLISNLFFCGEVLNIDGVTGGFNFQNAWSTAWMAAQLGG